MATLQTMHGVRQCGNTDRWAGRPRCANPRQLMTYLGLVSSEQSSGSSVTRDSITKASNSAASGLLIDAA